MQEPRTFTDTEDRTFTTTCYITDKTPATAVKGWSSASKNGYTADMLARADQAAKDAVRRIDIAAAR